MIVCREERKDTLQQVLMRWMEEELFSGAWDMMEEAMHFLKALDAVRQAQKAWSLPKTNP